MNNIINYPIHIIKKRIEREDVSGLVVVDKMYNVTPLNKRRRYKIGINFILVCILIIIFLSIYVIPYMNIKKDENISNQHLKSTKDLFSSKSLTNNLKSIGVEEFNKVEYADDTVMIEIDSNNIDGVLTSIENSQGVLDVQYQDNKFFIVMLRGGL